MQQVSIFSQMSANIASNATQPSPVVSTTEEMNQAKFQDLTKGSDQLQVLVYSFKT